MILGNNRTLQEHALLNASGDGGTISCINVERSVDGYALLSEYPSTDLLRMRKRSVDGYALKVHAQDTTMVHSLAHIPPDNYLPIFQLPVVFGGNSCAPTARRRLEVLRFRIFPNRYHVPFVEPTIHHGLSQRELFFFRIGPPSSLQVLITAPPRWFRVRRSS